MPREFTAHRCCGEITVSIRQALNAAGFHVEQSFDLRSALALVPGCTCPHHGTALCNCQYAVMLVYGQTSSPPITLVAHGRDNECWIALSDPPDGQESVDLVSEIVLTLAQAHLITFNEDCDVTPPVNTAH